MVKDILYFAYLWKGDDSINAPIKIRKDEDYNKVITMTYIIMKNCKDLVDSFEIQKDDTDEGYFVDMYEGKFKDIEKLYNEL